MLLAGPLQEWKIRAMTRYMQSCILGSILGLATILPGCTQDNQTAAKIEGTVPNDGLTTQQRRQQSATGIDSKAAGYTGKGTTGTSSSSGRRQ
jgi:hypothetical protein